MRLLRISEVQKLFPVSKQTIWRMSRAGKFPQSYILAGGRVRGWLESDIDKFIQGVVEAGASPCSVPVPKPKKSKGIDRAPHDRCSFCGEEKDISVAQISRGRDFYFCADCWDTRRMKCESIMGFAAQ